MPLRSNIPYRTELFFYGTCLDPEVLAIVLARPLPACNYHEAVLEGYRITQVACENYPMLAPAAGHSVAGAIFKTRGTVDLDRLCFFEGDEYQLQPESVRTSDGKTTKVMLFMDLATATTCQPWQLADWQCEHKPALLPRIRRFMSYFESGDLAAAEHAWDAA